MQPLDIPRGARRLLERLLWYQTHWLPGHVHPSQKKLASKLEVSDRQLRTYLARLRSFGFVVVRQGGDGKTASYEVTPAAISWLTSGLLPVCFRAEDPQGWQESEVLQQVAAENFRAETPQSGSCVVSGNERNQSESSVVGSSATDPPSDYEKAQTAAIVIAVKACGFECTPELVAKLERVRQYHGVTGFRIAAEIARAFKLVEATSNAPQKPAWFSAVVENALREIQPVPRVDHRAAIAVITSAPMPHSVADQVDASGVRERSRLEGVQARANAHARRSPIVAPVACDRCMNSGIVVIAVNPEQYAWCDCAHAERARREKPDRVELWNAAAPNHPRVATSLAKARPPQRASSITIKSPLVVRA